MWQNRSIHRDYHKGTPIDDRVIIFLFTQTVINTYFFKVTLLAFGKAEVGKPSQNSRGFHLFRYIDCGMNECSCKCKFKVQDVD